MFYAILPERPPVFAVQPNKEALTDYEAGELINRLERHFMHRISLVSWDAKGKFVCLGFPVSEEIAANEDLEWREFEFPPDPEVPF